MTANPPRQNAAFLRHFILLIREHVAGVVDGQIEKFGELPKIKFYHREELKKEQKRKSELFYRKIGHF